MKAIIYCRYGNPDVLRLAEIKKPTPAENEVLIKVMATTVNSGDARMRAFNVPPGEWLPARLYLGVFGPRRRILGMQLAGVVEAVGTKVTRFQPGDELFGSTGMGFGAHAEYKCLPEASVLTYKPKNMSFAEAAAVPTGALGALALVRQGKIRPGDEALVYGASGSVGTYAVQLAKHCGAVVTAVCGPTNQALAKSLGADHIIDYRCEDFARGSRQYDCIFDAVDKLSRHRCRRVLAPAGTYTSMHGVRYRERVKDLVYLRELIEAGHLKTVIDRSYPLAETPTAHRYVDTTRKKGNVVIQVA